MKMTREHDKTCRGNNLCDRHWNEWMKTVTKDIEKAKKLEPNHPLWNYDKPVDSEENTDI